MARPHRLLGDGVEEPADARLASIRGFHALDGQRSSALGQSLNDYATLAESLKDRLSKVDTSFDPVWIQEACTLAKTLATSPAPSSGTSNEATAATTLRNQLLILASTRATDVRKAARRVFRTHREIIKQCTSAYERRRRAQARAKQDATPPADPPTK